MRRYDDQAFAFRSEHTTTPVRFKATRGSPIGLACQCPNRSAQAGCYGTLRLCVTACAIIGLQHCNRTASGKSCQTTAVGFEFTRGANWLVAVAPTAWPKCLAEENCGSLRQSAFADIRKPAALQWNWLPEKFLNDTFWIRMHSGRPHQLSMPMPQHCVGRSRAPAVACAGGVRTLDSRHCSWECIAAGEKTCQEKAQVQIRSS